jgi:SAM-dependent methyltransferase
MRLTPLDFEAVFGDPLGEAARKRIEEYGFRYAALGKEDHERWVHQIVAEIETSKPSVAGENRLSEWEDGWAENLEAFKKKPDAVSLIPRYFYKDKVNRWRGELICPLDDLFEYHALIEIEDWLFRKYLGEVDHIYEFGCGTGHNLLRARYANSNANLWGLDWTGTSWEIIREMVKSGILHAARGARFDFFNPDAERTLDKNSGVYTVAALEQVGTRFEPFVEYLIAQRPVVCVHIEPIAELLDDSVLLDRLTLAYMKKRNYLSGFLPYLQEQEKKGRVVIHWAQRTHIGGLFTESNSVVVWSPR